jgi:hypothetical protein
VASHAVAPPAGAAVVHEGVRHAERAEHLALHVVAERFACDALDHQAEHAIVGVTVFVRAARLEIQRTLTGGQSKRRAGRARRESPVLLVGSGRFPVPLGATSL